MVWLYVKDKVTWHQYNYESFKVRNALRFTVHMRENYNVLMFISTYLSINMSIYLSTHPVCLAWRHSTAQRILHYPQKYPLLCPIKWVAYEHRNLEYWLTIGP